MIHHVSCRNKCSLCSLLPAVCCDTAQHVCCDTAQHVCSCYLDARSLVMLPPCLTVSNACAMMMRGVGRRDLSQFSGVLRRLLGGPFYVSSHGVHGPRVHKDKIPLSDTFVRYLCQNFIRYLYVYLAMELMDSRYKWQDTFIRYLYIIPFGIWKRCLIKVSWMV